MRDIAEEFGADVVVDASTFRPEQPVFVPPTGATLARFDGDPLAVDAYLAREPSDASKARDARQAAASTEELLDQLLAGANLHQAALRLVGKWVAKGVDDTTIREMMAALQRWPHRPAATSACGLCWAASSTACSRARARNSRSEAPTARPSRTTTTGPTLAPSSRSSHPRRVRGEVALARCAREYVLDEADGCRARRLRRAPLIVALGSVIGSRCALKPKKRDDWMSRRICLAVVVGDPATKKPPPSRRGCGSWIGSKPMRRIDW